MVLPIDTWITDTPTTDRFPLYTRGNADEVGPRPFPPLTWSLAWEQGASPGTADAWVHLGAFRPEEFRQPVPEVFGCWGGYFYNQVSVGRVFGVRTPGGSPDAIDQAYFGRNPQVPPYRPDPRDEAPDLSEAVGETLAWILSTPDVPNAETFVRTVHRWAAERPDLASLDDGGLVAHGRLACHRLRETWDVYAQVVVGASVGPGVVQSVLDAAGRGEDAVALFTSLGGVETAGTADRVWRMSRLVRSSPFLTGAFQDAGPAGVMAALAASPDPAARSFLVELSTLLAEDGHRGPNEWDLASDTWLTRPELALAMVDRIRRQDDNQAPARRAEAGTALRERVTSELEAQLAADAETLGLLRAATRSGQLFYRAREAGKDAAVRVMLEAKLPFFELARRGVERGHLAATGHVFQLLESELDDFLAHPDGWREVLAARAETFAALADVVPPYTVAHGTPVPPISEWPRRAESGSDAAVRDDVLTGIGVSPGVVTGPARVVHDLSEADGLEPGEILVCGTTDPSWVPLFMVAGGVVCEIGAQASHAAIVSREIGVPCVASVRAARSRLRTGNLLTLDGSRGTVRVDDA